METTKFGGLLRKHRKQRDLSLGQMAERIDVAPSYLSDVELGRRNPFKREMIDKIGEQFEMSAQEVNELIDAASDARGQFELPADRGNPAAFQAGAALAREWTTFTATEYQQLTELIQTMKSKKA